ncbi:hypothetical protein SESI111939_20200 [Serratia silvae]
MKYVFIEKHQAEFSIKAMCRVLRVARSDWYAWRLRRHRLVDVIADDGTTGVRCVADGVVAA